MRKNKILETNEKEDCIILNKPFIGGYIDRSNENEAHELINFFLDDKANPFIYCNPYGQNVNKAEKYNIKYLLFTSGTKSKTFYIEYIIGIKKVLHHQSLPKQTINNKKTIESKIGTAKEEIDKNLKEVGYNGLEDVKYGGINVNDLFTDDIQVIPLTFLADKDRMYKLKKPIKITFKENEDDDIFDYNFQRNFGYVTSKTKKPDAYSTLNKAIVEAINSKNVEVIPLKKFNANQECEKEKPTFMDMISMYRQEECYTQILYKLLDYNKNNLVKFFNALGIEESLPEDNWDIQCEYYIEKVGRLDIYAYRVENNQITNNIIIENKIDSGINFSKGTDQLTHYHKHFEDNYKGKNIYLILCPNENLSRLRAEIESVVEQNVRDDYKIVGYNMLCEFLKSEANLYKNINFEYCKYVEDIIELFRRLSLTRQEMCEENLLNNYRNNIKKKSTNVKG